MRSARSCPSTATSMATLANCFNATGISSVSIRSLNSSSSSDEEADSVCLISLGIFVLIDWFDGLVPLDRRCLLSICIKKVDAQHADALVFLDKTFSSF